MPSPLYSTPIDPAAGECLGATQTNNWVRNIHYLHGLALGGYEPFDGISVTPDAGGEIKRWWFVYGGQPKIYHNISGASDVYVTSDGAEQHFTPAYANPLVLTNAYTVGKRYALKLYAGAAQAVSVSYMYTPLALPASAWSTPPTFTDNVLSQATDFAGLTASELYLQGVLEAQTGTFKAITWTNYPSTSYKGWSGSFVYKGLNSLFWSATGVAASANATATLHIFDNVSDHTVATVTTGVQTGTYDLSALKLTLGVRYAIWWNVASGAQAVTQVVFPRLFITGTRNLSPSPPPFLVGQYGNGSTGDPRLQYLSDALTFLRGAAEYDTIGGVDYGRFYLTPDSTGFLVKSPNAGAAFLDFRRRRRLRYLHYLPTGVGSAGSLVYASDTHASVQLTDVNGDSSWCAYDLEAVPLLPQGYIYKVFGVHACYESISSSS